MIYWPPNAAPSKEKLALSNASVIWKRALDTNSMACVYKATTKTDLNVKDMDNFMIRC